MYEVDLSWALLGVDRTDHRQGRRHNQNSVREHGEIVSGSAAASGCWIFLITFLITKVVASVCGSWRFPHPPSLARLGRARRPFPTRARSSQSEAPASGSMAPCRRSNCGRFCENAERGNTMSHPTSCAFCFKSPCTCERNPMIDVPFFNLLFSFGMSVKGLAFALFKSKMIREGCSTPLLFIRSVSSFSVFTNSTFTFILRPVS